MSQSTEVNTQKAPDTLTPETKAPVEQSGRLGNFGRKIVSFFKDGYKPVPGRQEGQVEVLTSRAVRKRWGQPTVNFAGLTAMAQELGMPPEETKIKLYSGRWVGNGYEFGIHRLARGGHVPLTNTIYSGVGLNGTLHLPHPYRLSDEARSELQGSAQTAAMPKLVYNALKASGVRGPAAYERAHELYPDHAADVQFRNPSPDA